MHAIALRHFILIVSCLAAAPALAGIGGTSSGVTSTVGTQGTNASPDVQQQSAGFVQQNQQLQEAQNSVSPSGIVQPGGVANAAGVAGAAGAKGAPNAPNPGSKESPGDPGSAPSATPAIPATPPAPPPPPPTYVSVVKHLTPSQEAADAAGAVAVAPVPVGDPPDLAPAPVKADPPPAPVKAAMAAPPTAPVASTPTNAAANAKIGASERPTDAGIISGGSGPAPDGYTFYIGFGIALLLLAIAFGAYLSSQKDEVARRPPV